MQTKLLRSTMVLTAGRVAGYGLAFLRNLLLARLLAKTDYGLAAVFSMAMMMLELSSRMSFGTQIIQAKEGESPEFLGSAKSLQFLGGIISAALIACLSSPVAQVFGVPHTWWAFATLAIIPLSNGLIHLDVSRRQRQMDFIPLVAIDVIPQLLTTLAVWPLALWLKDYRVIVWVMIGKSVLTTVLSFFFAQRPYIWAWHPVYISRMLNFGWPLILNGLLMLASQQLDQMIIGAAFSLTVLANYSLAFSLVSTPWFILSQVLSSIMLPLMSSAQDDPARLHRQYSYCAQISAAGGILILLPIILAGEQIIVLLYGQKYHDCGLFMAILGSAAAIRFLRYAPAVAAMAKADTINQMYSNLWRLISLPLALVAWKSGAAPILIATCALVGEIVASAASLWLLKTRQHIPIKASVSAIIFLTAFVALGILVTFTFGPQLSLGWAAGIAVGGFSLALGSAYLIFPGLVAQLLKTKNARSSRPAAVLPASG